MHDLPRLTRLANVHSKKRENHHANTALYFTHRNPTQPPSDVPHDAGTRELLEAV